MKWAAAPYVAFAAIAFLAFAEANVEVAVLEVGMGGRLDATNIVEPAISVITDIALDHTEWLGSTLTEIAREKAGILRPGGRMVTLPQHPEANIAIGEVAMALGVSGINAATFLPERGVPPGPYPLTIDGETITIAPVLVGDHQNRNLALAIGSAVELTSIEQLTAIKPSAIEAGVRLTRWPGRLESLASPSGNGTILLDVAHNPAGAWTLRSHLSHAIAAGTLPAPRTLIFSALRDKSVREMAQILFPSFDEPGDRILLAPVNSPRASSGEELAAVAEALDTPVIICASVAEAMELATAAPGSVVVSGSVYLVGEAKAWIERGVKA